jgi:succinate-acetate transporter protein
LALLAFVFPLQLLASVLGFLSRDSVAGTGMGILAGTWLTTGLIQLTSPPGSTSDGLGLFLVVAGMAMLVPATGAALGKLVPAAVLLTTPLRFFATGIYQLTADRGWKLAAGWVGVLLFAVAVYAALAAELEDMRGKPALPTGRRAKGKLSVEGTLLDQVMDVHHEPGVRRQL